MYKLTQKKYPTLTPEELILCEMLSNDRKLTRAQLAAEAMVRGKQAKYTPVQLIAIDSSKED